MSHKAWLTMVLAAVAVVISIVIVSFTANRGTADRETVVVIDGATALQNYLDQRSLEPGMKGTAAVVKGCQPVDDNIEYSPGSNRQYCIVRVADLVYGTWLCVATTFVLDADGSIDRHSFRSVPTTDYLCTG